MPGKEIPEPSGTFSYVTFLGGGYMNFNNTGPRHNIVLNQIMQRGAGKYYCPTI